MKESFEKWAQRFEKVEEVADAKADGKCADDDNDDPKQSKHSSAVVDAKHAGDSKGDRKGEEQSGDDSHAQAPPVMMFFQPVSLDSMIQHVLNLTEYATFSHIMRTKVRQRELFRMLKQKVSEHPEQQRRRQADLDERVNLHDIFDELVDRICGLTPHQKAIQEQVRNQLRSDDWAGLLAAGSLVALKFFIIFNALSLIMFRRWIISV